MKYVNAPVMKKRCHGACDGKTSVYGRCGTERLSDRKSTQKSSCTCPDRRDQYHQCIKTKKELNAF